MLESMPGRSPRCGGARQGEVAGGANLFLYDHRVKIQMEFASSIANADLRATPALHQIILQTQLTF
jgi:hypothetical protein